MHHFKSAPSEKHLDARVISSLIIKLAFTAASLLAVAMVNKFCCNCSLYFNSWTIFCFFFAYQCYVQVSDSESRLLCFLHISPLKVLFGLGTQEVGLWGRVYSDWLWCAQIQGAWLWLTMLVEFVNNSLNILLTVSL